MKLIVLALGCVALALIAIACTETATTTNTATPRTTASPAAASPSASTDEFANARAIYKKNCEPCHGPNADGGLAKVDNKQIKVPSLRAAHAIKHPDEQLTKTIANGEEQMPAFKNKLKPEEINEMVRYIRKVVQAK